MSTARTARPAAFLLAVAAIASLAHGAGAQSPLKPRGGLTPTLLSDCDATQGSCGGTPYIDGLGGTYSGSPFAITGGGTPVDNSPQYVCGGGNLSECRRTSVETCTMWIVTQANGTISITVGASNGGSIGGGATRSCAETTTVTTIEYLRKVK